MIYGHWKAANNFRSRPWLHTMINEDLPNGLIKKIPMSAQYFFKRRYARRPRWLLYVLRVTFDQRERLKAGPVRYFLLHD